MEKYQWNANGKLAMNANGKWTLKCQWKDKIYNDEGRMSNKYSNVLYR